MTLYYEHKHIPQIWRFFSILEGRENKMIHLGKFDSEPQLVWSGRIYLLAYPKYSV